MPAQRFVVDCRVATRHFPGIGSYTRNLHAGLLPLLEPSEHLSAITAANSRLLQDNATLPATHNNFSLRQQHEIPSLLRQHNATLYHSPYYLMPYRPGVTTVLTVYDFIAFHYPQYLSARARLLFRFTHGLAIRTANAIVCISAATQRDLVRYSQTRKPIYVTPLAASDHFRPIDPTPTRVKLGLPNRYILYFGSNKPHKNITTLISAMAQLPDAPPLVIAGSWLSEHPEPKVLTEQLGLQDRVHFLGRIDEMEDVVGLYCGATLFAFPSLYEGFGLPVIEALACGVAVACGNVWSLPEVGGDAVAYFEPDSAESIAHTINQLLTDADLRTALAKRGIKQAAQFSWRRTATQTLAVYRSLT